jgi:hypothetical protein
MKKYRVVMEAYGNIPHMVPSSYSHMRKDFKRWNAYMCRSIFGKGNNDIEQKLYTRCKGEFSLLKDIKKLVKWMSPSRIMSGKVIEHERDGGDNQKKKYLKPETVIYLEREMADVIKFCNDFQKEYDQKA